MVERNGKLHKDHRKRMRKRFARDGISGFSEHELIEYMLFYAIPRCDTNETAHLLEDEFGSVENLIHAPRERIMSIKGLGENAALFCEFISQISSLLFTREYAAKMKEPALTETIRSYFLSLYMGKHKEVIYAAGFDREMRLVCSRKIAEGDLGSVESPIRTLYDFSVSSGCDRIVIAHNHPGANCLPSPADVYNTTDLVNRLRWLDITLEDHIIVGSNGAFSLRGSMHAASIWGEEKK